MSKRTSSTCALMAMAFDQHHGVSVSVASPSSEIVDWLPEMLVFTGDTCPFQQIQNTTGEWSVAYWRP